MKSSILYLSLILILGTLIGCRTNEITYSIINLESDRQLYSFYPSVNDISIRTLQNDNFSLSYQQKEGWIKESYAKARAFKSLSVDGSSLIVNANFLDEDSRSGEAYYELLTDKEVDMPLSFVDTEITVDYSISENLLSKQYPFGIQVFLISENVDGQKPRLYSDWNNIDAIHGTITFSPNTMSGTPNFDLDRIHAIGFKVALGTNTSFVSNAEISINYFNVDKKVKDNIYSQDRFSSLKKIAIHKRLKALAADTLISSQANPQFDSLSVLSFLGKDLLRKKSTDQIILGNLHNLPIKTNNYVESVTVRKDSASNTCFAELEINYPSISDSYNDRTSRVSITLDTITDLSNKTISAWFATDIWLEGIGLQPNTVSFYLIDRKGNFSSGGYIKTAGSAFNWQLLEYVPPIDETPAPLGARQDGFDVTQIEKIGVSFHRNRFAHSINMVTHDLNIPPYTYKGRLFISNFYFKDNNYLQANCPINALEQEGINRNTSQDFLVGINYPWMNYGWDIGSNPYGRLEGGLTTRITRLRNDFSEMSENHVDIVRVFLFSDMRTGIVFDEIPVGLDSYVYADMRALFSVAAQYDIKLIPVLIDFNFLKNLPDSNNELDSRNYKIISELETQDAFLKNCIEPILEYLSTLDNEFPDVLYALDIGNELGNSRYLSNPINYCLLRDFIGNLINYIRVYSSEIPVTLGVRNAVDLEKYWADIPLDIFQLHYYDNFEKMKGRSIRRSNKSFNLSGPIIYGEVEPTDVYSKIELIHKKGFEGVLFWSLNGKEGHEVDLTEIRRWKIMNAQNTR